MKAPTAQNKAYSFLVTFILHFLLLVLLLFFKLTLPNPPITGGSGVVLNLGFVDEGTGEVQTFNAPNPSSIIEENKPIENPQPTNNDPVSTPPSENQDNDVITGEEESDIKVKPTTPKDTPAMVADKNKNKEDTKEAEKPKINPNALFSGQNGTSNKGGNNNGDKLNAIGDQGNPLGDAAAKARYGELGSGGDGSGGSGGGASLDLAGWKWDKKPRVNDDNEDENGRIVYQITIDDRGDIISIKTLESTVSPNVEKLYRQEVEKLSFTKTDNKTPAPTSTGKITFIIRAK